MEITVNNEKYEFKGNTLAELLSELNIADNGYAIAVGKHVVPRLNYDKYQLVENDIITIIGATHGG